VSLAHPRTMALADPEMSAVSTLLGTPFPPALRAAVDIAGGTLVAASVAQVSWWPGRQITVRYEVDVSGGALDGPQVFVCAAGRIPEGAMMVEGDGEQVGVWRVPYDPALPGMASALDDREVERLLVDLGSSPGKVTTRLRAYRPGRRAVIEARGAGHDIFLKVIRPSRIESLHRVHRSLAEELPVPISLGVDTDLGIVALQALPGETLRQTLGNPARPLPGAAEIAGMVEGLPEPPVDLVAPSVIERTPRMARLLSAITPELSGRIETLVSLIGEESVPAGRPVHGDYYEAQLMVEEGRLTGILDVDTYGWGRPGDDPATMLGHLSVWGPLSPQPSRVGRLGDDLLRLWDGLVDPVDLRLRSAAVALSLASGPFRVQSAAWPSEVSDRLAIAERWVDSAARVDEKTLIPFSE
jgi:hypothetical protein